MSGRPPMQPSSTDQSNALSLLGLAAADRDSSQRGDPSGGLAEALRMRGLGAEHGLSFEDQLYLQQQGALGGGHHSIYSQFRDQNLLSQLNQQQQLAVLLGLGGHNQQAAQHNDLRQALAAQQLRQQQQQVAQFSHADLLALSRAGALGGLSGVLGGQGQSHQGLASEIEGLQRMEELERRQRMLSQAASPYGAAATPAMGHKDIPEPSQAPSMTQTDSSSLRPNSNQANSDGGAGAMHKQQPKSPAPSPREEVQAAAQDSNKDEIEKAPGSVIVPCRARGMPMDHNFKTAYFVIPENVKHGEELICSYFACRNAGIKFRYCSHCKVPVAKRNFRKRHKHGGEDVDKIPGDDSGGEDDTPVKGIPSQITASREEAADADGISSQSADSETNLDKNHGISEADVKQGLVRSSMRTFETSRPEKAAATGEAKDGDKISSARRNRWAELLAKRPATKDGDSMSDWLMEVLAVSDLESPLRTADAPSSGKKTENGAKISSDPQSNQVDDENDEDFKKEGTSEADTGSSSALANSGIVKKKRPAEALVSGSFAEWKERKKQKKQSKLGSVPKEQV